MRIIKAFDIFKKKTNAPHKLVLVGKPGFGYDNISLVLGASRFQDDIHELGYVSETEKWKVLREADVFLFPSLYEGFGLPVIEAQSVGVPVITSSTSSLLEIAGEGALLVDPLDVLALVKAMETLVKNREKRADIIEKAIRNADRFSWVHCAQGIARLFLAR